MAEAAVAGLAGGSVDLAVAGPALVTLAAVPFRSLAWAVAFMFGTLLVVLAVAVIGGVWPALTAVVVGVLARATLLTHPSGNLPSVAHANVAHANVVSPVLFAVVGTALSVLVGKLAELAREQAALRRMATLVAHAAPAEELFAAVTEEVGWLVAANLVGVARYDPGDSLTSVRAWTKTGEQIPAGSRWPLARDLAISVSRTGRPAWSRSIAGASGPVAADSRQHGVRSAAVVPIIAGDRTWGVMFTGWGRMRAPTSATEARLASFTDLVAAAIANAENLVELTASRARVVTAADETRRRIERDLHDGAQ